MKITEIAYGKDKSVGYSRLLDKSSYLNESGCEKFLEINSDTGLNSIRYSPLACGNYLLAFVMGVPEGTSFDKRGQMFIHGYVFDQEAADALWENPEWMLALTHYSHPEEIDGSKPGEWDSWDPLLNENVKVELDKKEDSKIERVYADCIFSKQVEQKEKQLLHILSDDGEKNLKKLLEILQNFQLKKRRELSWDTNAVALGGADYNILCMSQKNFEKIQSSGYAGGKAIQRYVLNKNQIQKYECSEKMKQFLDCYFNENENEIVQQEAEEEEMTQKKGKKSVKKNTQRKANGGVRKFGKEIVAMVICLAVLFYTVQFTKGEEAYYTIRVTNDVVAGGALFLLGWCAGGIETKYHRGKK